MITPEDLLVFARRFCCENASEVELRASASRAYYAGYLLCDELDRYLPSLGGDDVREGVHQARIKKFRNFPLANTMGLNLEQVALIRQLGVALLNSKAKRHLADYCIDVPFTFENTQLCHNQVEEIMALHGQLFASVAPVSSEQEHETMV